jgi:hypothetical protein
MSGGGRSNPIILVMGEALLDVVTRGEDVDEHPDVDREIRRSPTPCGDREAAADQLR